VPSQPRVPSWSIPRTSSQDAPKLVSGVHVHADARAQMPGSNAETIFEEHAAPTSGAAIASMDKANGRIMTEWPIVPS